MNLKEMRVFKGFSQQKAANLVNISLRTYKRYENEKQYENTLKYKAILGRLSELNKIEQKTSKISYPKVVIIGGGFVGLNTGKVLSKKCDVSFVDNDEKVIEKLTREGFKNSFLSVNELKRIDIAIICLPTNLDEKTKVFNTESIEKILEEIYLKNKYAAVIIKSTVSIGFTQAMSKKFKHNIAFMPEFLREKSALSDALNPSRLIIGIDKESDRIKNFAKCVEKCIENPRKTIFMSTREAEATKLFSNAYLAMRVAFFNELDSYALGHDLNSKKIIKSVCADERIGDYYNNPSFCFSGYCFPKDTQNLETQSNSDLIKGVIISNEKRKDLIVEKIISEALKIKENPTIGFYNLDSQNNRPSSTIEIFKKIQKYPVNVVVFDKNYENSMDNFVEFCELSDLIITNTYDDKLENVKNKIFTRDLLSK